MRGGLGVVAYDRDPAKLADGWNVVDPEEIFTLSNPALGLRSSSERFQKE